MKKALVERASEVEKQCEVVAEAMAVLRQLQMEVAGVDEEGLALGVGEEDDDDRKEDDPDLTGEFFPMREFEELEVMMKDAVSNARRLIEEGGGGAVVVVEDDE